MSLGPATTGVEVIFRWSFDFRSDSVTGGGDSAGLFSAHSVQRPTNYKAKQGKVTSG